MFVRKRDIKDETINPFRYGSLVDEGHYCIRGGAQKRLQRAMHSGQNVTLIGERRTGKSSLIYSAAEHTKNCTLVYTDFWAVSDVGDFVRRCINAFDHLEDQEGLFKKITRAIPQISVTMSVDPITGSPTLTPTLNPTHKPTPETIAQVARLWASLVEKGQKLVIALDEFQDILKMKQADQVLGVLRKEIQALGNVSVIFSGSIRSDMEQIFINDKSPFYKSSSILFLDKRDFDDWDGFLKERFKSGDIGISDELLSQIKSMANENPGDTQQLCSAVWEMTPAGENVTEERIRQGLAQIFRDENKAYEHIMTELTSQQLSILRTLAQLGGASIQSKEFLLTAGIAHASSSKSSVTRLLKLRILQEGSDGEKVQFSNPFFKQWLIWKKY